MIVLRFHVIFSVTDYILLIMLYYVTVTFAFGSYLTLFVECVKQNLDCKTFLLCSFVPSMSVKNRDNTCTPVLYR